MTCPLVGFAPHRPSRAQRGEPGLVPGRVDRLHARQPEVPHQVGRGERREESAAGRVDVQRDIGPAGGVQVVEGAGDPGDVLEQPGERLSQGGDHHDGVLVAMRGDVVGVHGQPVAAQRNLANLHVEIPCELLPTDLNRPADEVRYPGPTALAPAELRRQPAQHRRLARPRGRCAQRGSRIGRVPQVPEHSHAAPLQLGRLRVLVLVDDVLVQRFVHQPARLVVHPGGAERREVHPRDPVEQQFVVHHLVGDPREGLLLGEPIARRGRAELGQGEQVVEIRCVGHLASPSGLLGVCHLTVAEPFCNESAAEVCNSPGRRGC